MVRSYWRRVFPLALKDTLSALSLDSVERAVLPIAGAVVGIVFVWWFTAGDSLIELVLRMAGTVAIFAILPVVYLWKFIVTPAKIDAEAHEMISDLNRKLDDREQQERVRNALWELREEGVKIRNDGLTTRAINSWDEKFAGWHAKVLVQAANLSSDLHHSLDPIDKIAPESNERPAVDSATHQRKVSVMSEMLSRLYRYLDRTS